MPIRSFAWLGRRSRLTGSRSPVVVGRANLEEDRTDSELVLVDVASHAMRVLTRRMGVGFPRWSPDGKSLAFIATDDKKKLQIWILAIGEGGDSEQLTHSPTSIEQLAWRPDGKAIAFVAEDDEPEKKGRAKFDDAFEIGSNDFLAREKQMPAHLWVIDVPADTGGIKKPEAKRLTSGSWSLPVVLPPSPPASPVQWSPDGKSLYFVKVPTPLSGDGLASTVQVMDVATGHYKPLTGAPALESAPVISPDGSQIAYLRNQDGKAWNESDVLLATANGAAKARTSRGSSIATSSARSGCRTAGTCW